MQLTWNICVERRAVRKPRRVDGDDEGLGAAGRKPEAQMWVASIGGYRLCCGIGGVDLHDQRLDPGQVEQRSLRLQSQQ